ncbi:MAG TPA: hypothetical protein VKZ53_01035 [Candidatus Angelobacter sp.]|nr:hypothetical protein [Candidatus Angelobacter sp.]
MRRLLYSWIDVDLTFEEQRAAGKWPRWLMSASTYHDGVLLRVKNGTSRIDVDGLLSTWYGPRFESSKGIRLEAVPGEERLLPVEIEETAESGPTPMVQPIFRRVAVLPEKPAIKWPKAFDDTTPPIVSFFSFKGGVGRTTELLASLTALGLSRPLRRAIIVDADLEAPGVTALVAADRKLPGDLFSLADFLAVCHSDRSPDANKSLELAAHACRKQVIEIRAKDWFAEHFFLPAHRDDTQLMRLDIRPEHLILSADSTWLLGDLLAALGKRLKVDVVLVDLRAGLSELSSPMLFDPRIRRVLVTTPSEQSVAGTEFVLKQLAKMRPPADEPQLYDPTVVIGFVSPELAASDELQNIRLRLLTAYPDPPPQPDSLQQEELFAQRIEDQVGALRIKETNFHQELLYTSTFSSTIAKLQMTSLPSVMAELMDEFVPTRAEQAQTIPIAEARQSLADFAKKLEYAESGQGDRYLPISPLRALAKQFEEKIPTAVIVGSKGSGKTYTCLQVVRSKTWSAFVARTLGRTAASGSGLIWPFLQSKNLQHSASQLVRNCRQSVVDTLLLKQAKLGSLEIEDAVQESLQHTAADERWWRIRWLRLIADSLGISAASENEAAGRMIEVLRKAGQSLLILVDGLEDLFPVLDKNAPQQVALRALLQGVPAYLKEIPECPLGVVVFVRADLVLSAIPQNVGQFERLYEPFALRWDEEEALRLAVWIAREGGAPVETPENRALELVTLDEARLALIPVWGRKLGRDNSREARTAEWVIAALSDFKGQIQARDLVRFFRYAAEKSMDAQAQDRVLVPPAIRGAILPCSQQKVREIQQEIEPLNDIFAKLQESTERRIPFDAASSGLAADQIQFLMKTGVLIEDKGEYFMPEIFRLGLGFQLATGARPRVLSFARTATPRPTR